MTAVSPRAPARVRSRLAGFASSPRGGGALALALYAAISFAYFGLPVVAEPSGRYVGLLHVDPPANIWFLAWWPYAITHLINPLMTDVVLAPDGANLMQVFSIPGPALALAPVTFAFGPVVSYNLLIVASPALSAWTAFLLCRYLTRSFWPSLAAGYLFGFSTYELGHLLNHLSLALTFLLPVAVHLVLRRIDGDISERRFVVYLALVGVGQFLITPELTLSAALFGLLALVIAQLFGSRPRGRAIRRTIGSLLKAGVLAAVVVAPFLFYALIRDLPTQSVHPLEDNSSDLLNLVVATPVTLLGPHKPFGNLSEHTAYLGIPLLAALALYGWERWRAPSTKLVLGAFAFFVLASLGPVLHVNGRQVEELPWKLLADVVPWKLIVEVPLLSSLLPARFMLFGFLTATIGIALWLAARTRIPQTAKWLLVGAGLVLLIPDVRPSSSWWRTDFSIPGFFAEGLYRDYITRGDTVVVVPFGQCGQSMLWQAESDMYFKMTGDALGPVNRSPPSPTVASLLAGVATEGARRELPRYLAEHDVRAVFVVRGTPGEWTELFAPLGKPTAAGGVDVYAVPRALRLEVPPSSASPAPTRPLPRCQPGAWIRTDRP